MSLEQAEVKFDTYVGLVSIEATPMTETEYNSLRGWAIPEEHTDGFLVMRTGTPANHPDFKYYISWYSKDEFENSKRWCRFDLMPDH